MGSQLTVLEEFNANYRNVRRHAYLTELQEEADEESGTIYHYIKTRATANYHCERANRAFFNKEDALDTCIKWRVKEDLALNGYEIFLEEMVKDVDTHYRKELREKYE